ncbi:dual specificity protein phosphatase 23 isoform X3 [Phacochoerus africanus]|uniref:dual specificity protein phosphatase 23 isoform X3 n=1 Tax=Phacochoerus africanus TaxID=41426 RepID=UPI001FD8EEA4|nr:dual specificity protein phosphatase 23 isoform X3 [Phacochoerus africanus]
MGVQPPNFSWVLPGRLAGLALPRLPAHYQFLLDQGVRHLVSLTERGPPHHDSCPGLTLHRLRIPDFCPPGPEQIDRFVQIVDEANARGEPTPVRTSLKEKNPPFQAFRLKQRNEKSQKKGGTKVLALLSSESLPCSPTCSSPSSMDRSIS